MVIKTVSIPTDLLKAINNDYQLKTNFAGTVKALIINYLDKKDVQIESRKTIKKGLVDERMALKKSLKLRRDVENLLFEQLIIYNKSDDSIFNRLIRYVELTIEEIKKLPLHQQDEKDLEWMSSALSLLKEHKVDEIYFDDNFLKRWLYHYGKKYGATQNKINLAFKILKGEVEVKEKKRITTIAVNDFIEEEV